MWAITKCEFYLKGLPSFTVATDHKPLVGIFAKNLADLTNPRLRSLREKISGYTFQVEWVPGKTHHIADALSRAPLFHADNELDTPTSTALAYLAYQQDPALTPVSYTHLTLPTIYSV